MTFPWMHESVQPLFSLIAYVVRSLALIKIYQNEQHVFMSRFSVLTAAAVVRDRHYVDDLP